jgi:hypothetical protein
MSRWIRVVVGNHSPLTGGGFSFSEWWRMIKILFQYGEGPELNRLEPILIRERFIHGAN